MKEALDAPGPVIVGVQVGYRDEYRLSETVKGDRIHQRPD